MYCGLNSHDTVCTEPPSLQVFGHILQGILFFFSSVTRFSIFRQVCICMHCIQFFLALLLSTDISESLVNKNMFSQGKYDLSSSGLFHMLHAWQSGLPTAYINNLSAVLWFQLEFQIFKKLDSEVKSESIVDINYRVKIGDYYQFIIISAQNLTQEFDLIFRFAEL